ncbi:MAG TPA: hypothetical protein VNW30_10430 [Opitutaceae bacterium]|jgi:hypothetical protein|nr:hypothetical protein [Opitutaceae bacterium]
MFPLPVIAFLTGMLVAAAYSALVVIFWGVVYIIGCVLIVVKSPKICKGIFAGSCNLGLMVGGALTAVTSAAMGMGKLGVAMGAFGAGRIGQAASTVFDVPLPGGGAAKPKPLPKRPGDEPASGGASQPGMGQPPASMEAILATGGPTTNHQAMGGVLRRLARCKTVRPRPDCNDP